MTAVRLSDALGRLRRRLDAGGDGGPADRELLRRFAGARDEAAFALLVRRHGSMVLSVCRRRLPCAADAADAFQATFLVLARRAGAVRWRASAAGWLYEAARRVAAKAAAAAARRRAHEREAAAMRATAAAGAEPPGDLRELLGEQLRRLPDAYRAALVLCYLEGRSHAEAARQLGVPVGTLKSRLSRGCARLRRALGPRGLGLSAAAVAALLGEDAAASAVPGGLAAATGRAAAASTAAAGDAAGALADGVLRTLGAGRLKLGTGLFLALVVAAGVGLAAYPMAPAGGGLPGKAADPPKPAPETRFAVDRHGDPLPEGAVARLGTTRFRSGGWINAVRFTPDSRSVCSIGMDAVHFFDATSGKRLRHFPAPAARGLGYGTLSPDGTLIATVGGNEENRTIRLRDAATGKLVRTFGGPKDGWPLYGVVFSPDGKTVVPLECTGRESKGGPVERWEVATGRQLPSLVGHQKPIQCAAFTADGRTLATGSVDGSVRFWDVNAGREVRRIEAGKEGAAKVALSPDGNFLAWVDGVKDLATHTGTENRVRLWDVRAGRELRQLAVSPNVTKQGIAFGITDLAFSPDGKSLATGGCDTNARLWDVATGRERWRFPVPIVNLQLAFSPDGKTLALAPLGPAVWLIDVASGKERVPDAGPSWGVFVLDVTPDGRTAVTAGRATIRLWDTATGRERRRLEWGPGVLSAARLVNGGHTLLAAGSDDDWRGSVLRSWDLGSGKETVRTLRQGKNTWTDKLLAVSPDGRTSAWGRGNQVVALVELPTGRELRSLTVPGNWILGTSFLPDGRTLVTWGGDGAVRRWDLATGRERGHFLFVDRKEDRPAMPVPVGGGGINFHAAVSPDGKFLAIGSDNRALALHDLATGEQVRRQEPLPEAVYALVFSPDSRTLAWGALGAPGVHLVETATLGERQSLTGHRGGICSLAFTADGRTLLSGSEDATVLVWDLTRPAGDAESRAGPPSAAELEARWKDLAGDDAARAYAAVRRLAAAPAEAVPFLAARLRPVPAADEQQLSRLIAALDGDTFAARDKAARELTALGERATAALRKALAGARSPEARRALQALLDRQARADQTPTGERLRGLRAVEALENAATPQVRRLLAALAAGAPEACRTAEAKAALNRLTRRTGVGPSGK